MAIKLNTTSGSITMDAEDGSGNVNVTIPRAGFLSSFILEDDDGTEVTLGDANEIKFIGSGVTTNWTDTSTGSDADPYDLTFTVDAAQTGITSIYSTDLIMGEDAQTAIDFGTANEIDFKVDNAARLTMTTGTLEPVTDDEIDLGTSSLKFKDAFFDGTVNSDAFVGPLTGNVTGNASGTAATVTGGTQAAITSAANLVTVGTIGTGVWQGTAIASGYIAGDAITGAKIADDAIDSEHYTDGSIDNAHIADNAIDSEHYADGSIDNAHIADDAIDSEHYADGSIDTAHIADDQVTLAKMAGLARGKIIYGDASGNPAVLTVGTSGQALTSDGTDISWGAGGLSTEQVQDIAGGMFTGNTETGITVTYQDGDGTVDFTIGTLNQDTTGLAASATALATSRTIGGVAFDGTGNISLPGVNAAGNQATSGLAATATLAASATALANARTIGGTSFDGTGNIAVGLAGTATALATARTIHGVSFDGTANIDLSEEIADTVGAMVSGNTETNVTVTYEDGDNTLDFVIGTLNQNTTGTAATVTTAAQPAITSVGTLTALTVDNVVIDGAVIGHTGDTDLMTLASGIVTVAGEVSMTTLDIGGTNVTSTAAELNLLDGVSGLVQADLTKLAAMDASAGELNYVSNVTSAIQTQLNSKAGGITASSLKSGNYTMASGDFIIATAGSITLTLPNSPSAGDNITIKDGTGAAATTAFTVARGNSNIASSATNLTFDKNFAEITMTYINGTIGWSV